MGVLSSCTQEHQTLTVFAGKGLKKAVDEIVVNFEKKESVSISVIYAGSKTLLDTIQKTQKGDIFIPGSQSYIKQAGKLIINKAPIAYHTPTFIVLSETASQLKTLEDLMHKDVRIALGNKHMSAIGRVSEAIINDIPKGEQLRKNIVITASTVNELIQLVKTKHVNAALVWKDMLMWQSAKGMTEIKIPKQFNKSKKIVVSSLKFTQNKRLADLFVNYSSSDEARKIFEKHGFDRL